mgnify:CR=1 FL=1
MAEAVIRLLTCLRCGETWYPQRPAPPPLRCAHCRSPYWQIPKRRAEPWR